MTIWFNIQEAYLQLTNNGEVYTIRPFKKRNGRHLFRSNFYHGEKFFVKVVFVKELDLALDDSKKELERYVNNSGFENVEDWLKKWTYGKTGYLHYVRILE